MSEVIVPRTGAEGSLVGKMTIHRNGIVEWNATNTGPDRFVAIVVAEEIPETKQVKIDCHMMGKPPPWFDKTHQKTMADTIRAHIRELEKEYYNNMGKHLSKH
jgi:hypothetical protein